MPLTGPQKSQFFKELIYLHAQKCVIIQVVSVLITPLFTHILLPFSTPAFSFYKKLPTLFKMCQTILTRSAYSSSYKYSPVGQILQPSSGCTVFEETLFLHKFFWRLVYWWKENNFPVCCYFSRYLFVLVMLKVPTHTSEEDRAWNSKWQRINRQTILLNWYLTQTVAVTFLWPIWQWHVW